MDRSERAKIVAILVIVTLLVLLLGPYSHLVAWALAAYIDIVCTAWVYQDARRRSMPQPLVLFWTVTVFFTNLLGFLAYLITTRNDL